MRRNKILFLMISLLVFIFTASGVLSYKQLNIVAFNLKGFDSYATPHFLILFKPENREEIPAVAKAAEKTYDIVGKDFGFFPEDKIPIVVYPDAASLRMAFNWPADESAQGVYYRNFIYLQAPGAWIENDGNVEKVFFEKGPMVHEYTHLVVDRLTSGNYSRWFTEGVAQYEEQRVTGYSLEQDFEIDKSVKYSYEDMFYRFDELPDVPAAYLQALDMTRALAGEDGIRKIKSILSQLKSGADADKIFLQRMGKSPFEGKSHLMTN